MGRLAFVLYLIGAAGCAPAPSAPEAPASSAPVQAVQLQQAEAAAVSCSYAEAPTFQIGEVRASPGGEPLLGEEIAPQFFTGRRLTLRIEPFAYDGAAVDVPARFRADPSAGAGYYLNDAVDSQAAPLHEGMNSIWLRAYGYSIFLAIEVDGDVVRVVSRGASSHSTGDDLDYYSFRPDALAALDASIAPLNRALSPALDQLVFAMPQALAEPHSKICTQPEPRADTPPAVTAMATAAVGLAPRHPQVRAYFDISSNVPARVRLTDEIAPFGQAPGRMMLSREVGGIAGHSAASVQNPVIIVYADGYFSQRARAASIVVDAAGSAPFAASVPRTEVVLYPLSER
ncbi:MAG: hypothetical protein JNJ63_11215 [Hyphomonadaceae bacterium]|nr:hypothetical protein [Hyphomonadaceae bacterium]